MYPALAKSLGLKLIRDLNFPEFPSDLSLRDPNTDSNAKVLCPRNPRIYLW